MRSQKKRNAKFYSVDTTLLDNAIEVLNNLITDVTSHVRHELNNGTIERIKSTGQESYVKIKGVEKELTRATYRDRIQHILDKYNVVPKIKGYERDVVGYVLERYGGYSQRNNRGKKTGKIPSINIKGKSIYYKNPFVKLNTEQKILSFTTMVGSVTVPYKSSLRDNNLTAEQKSGKKNVAGNLKLKQNNVGEFMVAYDTSFDTAYEPIGFISYDHNMQQLLWIVCNLPIFDNNSHTLPTPDEIVELCDQIRHDNDIINDRNKKVPERKYRTKDRTKARKRRDINHRKLNTCIGIIAQMLIDAAVERKYLLCIDGVATGATTGTFGQDHLIEELKKRCENQKIPYYIIPPAYTSQRCSKCKEVDPDNRKAVDEFKCVHCGHEEGAHINAAKNIAWEGARLYKYKWPCGNYTRWSGDTWEKQAKEGKKLYLTALSI